MTIREVVASEVRAEMARKRPRMSQRELGRLIDRKQPWISERLNGHVAFSVDELDLICLALGTTVLELLGEVYKGEADALDRRTQVKRTVGRTGADADLLVLVAAVPESAPDLIAA